MDLKNIKRRVRSLIREPQENFILDDELRDWANDASYEVTKEINYPWKEMTLYAVEGQADYDYPADFHTLHPLLLPLINDWKVDKYSIQWLDRYYPVWPKSGNVTQPLEYYVRFMDKVSIHPPPALIASGTATAGSNGTTLYDTSADFKQDYVGHAIQNTTDGSQGLIETVTSSLPAASTELSATLTGGTNNVWAEDDTYTINMSGTIPYVYQEVAMTEDTHESLVAKKFPFCIIYRILPMAEIKCFRVSSSQKEQNRAERWEKLYQTELVKAKNTVNRLIRGPRRTVLWQRKMMSI